ncbi:GAF domain-containing protein [Candidatus Poribacteria bacterium]|nr:GAF domain-containing protein [Candidatus Poribacteria bacterium]
MNRTGDSQSGSGRLPSASPVLERAGLDQLLEGCQIIGFDWKYLYVNDSLVRQSHKLRHELLGRTMEEVYPGIAATPVFGTIRRCMEERTPQFSQNEFVFPDGSAGWFELRIEPVAEGVLILSIEVTERVRAQRALERANRDLRMLSDCNQALIRATSEPAIIERICRVVVVTGGYSQAWAGLLDDSGLRTAHLAGSPAQCLGIQEALDAARSGKAVTFEAAGPDGQRLSGIALPLRCGEQPAGALTLCAADGEHFDAGERALLDEMASDLSFGLTTLRARAAHADAEARIIHLNSVLRGIRNVNQLITRQRDPQALIQSACEVLVESRGFETCCIVLLEGNEVRCVAGAGVEAKLSGVRGMVAQGVLPACLRRVLRESEHAILAYPDPDCRECPAYGDHGVQRDAVAVRLHGEGQTRGAILVTAKHGVLTEAEELDLLREVSGDISFALRSIEMEAGRGRAEASAGHFSGRLERLTQVVQDLSRARGLDAIATIVRTAARTLVGSDGATFVLRDGDRCHYVDEDAITPLWKGKRFPMSACISGWVMIHRQPVVIGDIYADDRIPHDAYRPTFVQSLAMVPIRQADPIGAIGNYWAGHHRATDEDLRILQALADSTSVALENTRAYEELERSERRYRDLVERLDDVVYSIAEDGRIQYVSTACERFGYSPEELIGQPFAKYVHPEDLAEVTQGIERARAISIEPLEFRVLDETGSVRYVRASCRALIEREEPAGVTGVLIDVTSQRLVEAQLRQSQKMDAVGRLAGGIAHDFNNLLAVIINYAQFALEGVPEAEPMHADLLEIRMAGERAAALTRQLLAFSRKQVLKPEVFDLNGVVTRMETMLRRLIGEDIELRARLDTALGTVKADPGQIEQVILNLAINARDAMPNGGKLTIETTNADLDDEYSDLHLTAAPGHYVMLSVADTGCGLNDEVKSRLFEPFFTTKDVGKGTGLGLATCYGIIRQSGGNIWVYSEPGRGTTFKIYLPRQAGPEATPRPMPPITRATGSETILLVEDEPGVRRLAQRILSTAGYTVLAASDGHEALAICQKNRTAVRLMLTDVVMPQMSGRELAAEVAKCCPRARILYMSGYTDNAIVHHGVLDEGTQFIGKPFTAAELTRKVREVLDAPAG